ncbi:MAG TPA: protein kilB [Gemmatimonadales bacterium]|nr:protein kilB [Gemmatimonadales bacterium]
MLTALLAVAGTLLGSIVTGTFQHLSAGRAERTAAAEQLRRERLEAVTALAAAGSDHRRALRMRGLARLRDADEAELEELRARSHATRSAITRPLVTLRLLVPDPRVHATAQEMVVATYDMVDAAGSAEELDAAQEAARAAHDRFVEAAAAYFSPA